MRVSELEGISLDYWVCQAELREFIGLRIDDSTRDAVFAKLGGAPYHPSTNWAQGGPIIERERIQLSPNFNRGGVSWEGTVFDTAYPGECAEGPQPLIAAMRAYVKSKFGEEVTDEKPGTA